MFCAAHQESKGLGLGLGLLLTVENEGLGNQKSISLEKE